MTGCRRPAPCADGGTAGRQDGAGLLIGNVPDSCIQRQADAAAVHFKIGEAACSRCQIALGQRCRGFYLGGADVGIAGRNDLRGQAGRVGDDHLECGNTVQRYIAAADDDIARNGDILKRYIARQNAPR